MKLRTERIPKEFLVDNVYPTSVHYFDSVTNEIIYQYNNKIYFRLGRDSGRVVLPTRLIEKIAYQNRLTTRLLRLDKGNVVWSREIGAIVIVFNFHIYQFDIETGILTQTKAISFRNGLFGGLCITPKGNIFMGEYSANWEKKPVNIWKGSNGGADWEVCFTFAENEIFHVHSVQWDPIENKIWVFTGDFKNECKVLVADEDFENIEYLGDGGQNWRVVKPIFLEDTVVWGMDSPISPVKINILQRENRSLGAVLSVSAPVWNSLKFVEGDGVIQTTIEQQDQIGVNSNESEILYTSNYENWSSLKCWKKDIFSNKYFRHGLTSFPDGPQSRGKFIANGEALEHFDGEAILCAIET